MLTITVHRLKYREEYTIGKMYLNGIYLCDTLEDRVRDIGQDGGGKISKETAIPAGEYSVGWNYSPAREEYRPILIGVPHFDGIRIHIGNYAGNTEGCILVGEHTGEKWVEKIGRETGWVGSSGTYVKFLYEIISKQIHEKREVEIIIKDVFFESHGYRSCYDAYRNGAFCQSYSPRHTLDVSPPFVPKENSCNTCPVRLSSSPLIFDATESEYPPLKGSTDLLSDDIRKQISQSKSLMKDVKWL